MGLTERHWFEDEEPKLTENQLEDVISEINNSYRKGYEKGYFDGQCAKFAQRESVPVHKIQLFHLWFWCCGACKTVITEGDKFCRECGKAVKWNET